MERKMPPTITATYLGALRTECTHVASGSKIVTDAPRDNYGKGEAFSPTDLCSTALGTCAMTIMAIAAQKMGKDISGSKMEITKHMAPDPRRIAKVEISFHLPGSFTDEEKQQLENAACSCPVCLSLGPETEQAFVFDWLN